MSSQTEKEQSKFADGEMILCYHGPLLYDAKCLKFRCKDGINEYFIHYSGWNKNWDEWVPETRVLKRNASNISKQKELQRSQKQLQKKGKMGKVGPRVSGVKDPKINTSSEDQDSSSRASTPDSRSRLKAEKQRDSPVPVPLLDVSVEGPKRNKRSKQDNSETEVAVAPKKEIKIEIPDDLKVWLVDDILWTEERNKQAILPARRTIDNLLEDYMNFKKGAITEKEEKLYTEAILGIKDLFNAMFFTKLLYIVERPGVKEFQEKNPEQLPTQFCGVNYFLRLFLRIDDELAVLNLIEKTMTFLLTVIQDILQYLANNASKFFSMSDYITR